MGAGDVKLMAGVGAWLGPVLTFWAFVSTALVGELLGVAMILASGNVIHHWVMLQTILHEILSIRNPAVLAGERPAQENNDASSLRYPDRDRLHRLLRLDEAVLLKVRLRWLRAGGRQRLWKPREPQPGGK